MSWLPVLTVFAFSTPSRPLGPVCPTLTGIVKRLGRKGGLGERPEAFTVFMMSEDLVNAQGQETPQLNVVMRRPPVVPEEERATVRNLARSPTGSVDSSLATPWMASSITLGHSDRRNSERIKSLYQMPRDNESNEGPRRQVVDDLKSSVRAKLLAAGICSQKDLDEEDELQVQCDELSRQSSTPKRHPTERTAQSTTNMHSLRCKNDFQNTSGRQD